ncbi:NUDIX hydrolase [Shimia abyssi]|uniref:8-oxo-dGTP diphosphatase n=1 Tax=Shimia abyssi TaxID=1662395 RepID=A0A2P8F9E6_9RHOB|nr:NUDIX hydrolase [Shimia abyssi]PSL18347.1 8-oxo-dGTP diphosphatase [Shimia abyssi]
MSVSRRDPADTVNADDFDGAKMVVFIGDRIVTLLRDDIETIPFPGFWDFPGGGRELGESPWDCVWRETREELSLDVPERAVVWSRQYFLHGTTRWFFVAKMAASAERQIALGDEGQAWQLLWPDDYLAHPKAIPIFQTRLSDYLSDR